MITIFEPIQELEQLVSERDVIRETSFAPDVGSIWWIGESERDWVVVKTVPYCRRLENSLPSSLRPKQTFGDVCLAFIAPLDPAKFPPMAEWDVTRMLEDYPRVQRYVKFCPLPEIELLTHGWRLDGSIKLGPLVAYLPGDNGSYVETPTDWEAVKAYPYEKPESELTYPYIWLVECQKTRQMVVA